MGNIISAAFFDLDHTLIRSNSGKLIVIHAYHKKFISTTDLLKAVYLTAMYRSGISRTMDVIASFTTWLKGMRVETFSELSFEIFEKYILKSLRPELLDRIALHKKEGSKTLILSSALYPLCRIISDRLGLDDPICSELEIIDGIYTGKSAGEFCFGEQKAARIKGYCEKNNIDLSKSWYYGDSVKDIPVMCQVGHPVCVNPDKKLKEKAILCGWEIL